MSRGKLVTVEGIDGSGKSTAIASLQADAAWTDAHSVVYEAEPTKTLGVGKFLRDKLRDDEKSALSDPHYVEQLALLMAADRVEHYWRVIDPLLASGKNVVCDRYTWSSYAYQCALGVDPQFVTKVNSIVSPPDLVVLIYIEPEVALQRIDTNREGTELFESLQSLKKVAAQYNWLLSSQTGIPEVDTTLRLVVEGKHAPSRVSALLAVAVELGLHL